MAQALGRYKHINANGSYLCTLGGDSQGMGMLLFVTINSRGTANTVTVYDGLDATGAIIAIIDTSLAIGSLLYEVVLFTGCFVVMAGGIAADITVVTH